MATDPERKHRGNPPLLTQEGADYLEHLWTQTTLPPSQIARAIADRFGVEINAAEHAARRGFTRELLAQTSSGLTTRAAREQHLTLAALARWTERKGPPPDNPTRITSQRFPVPAGGYRTGATR